MTTKPVESTRQPEKAGASGSGSTVIDQDTHPAPKDPPEGAKPAETGQPGGGRGRVDVTGIMPAGIRVDPYLTEGHPGYEESGNSELIPTERFTQDRGTEEKDST
jgi:hypothetical protein